jgi:hypothetical protein
VRIRRRRGQHKGNATGGIGDARHPRSGLGYHRIIVRSDLDEDIKGVQGRGWFAVGAAYVGFERVAEPAVVVAVGAQGDKNRSRRCLMEKPGQSESVEQACVGVHELLGGIDVNGHIVNVTRP